MDLVSQLGAIAVVMALLGAVLWYLRRQGVVRTLPARGRKRRVEILERLPLSPQHTLHLVRVGDQALLLAASPGGCSVLQTLPALGPSEGEVR